MTKCTKCDKESEYFAPDNLCEKHWTEWANYEPQWWKPIVRVITTPITWGLGGAHLLACFWIGVFFRDERKCKEFYMYYQPIGKKSKAKSYKREEKWGITALGRSELWSVDIDEGIDAVSLRKTVPPFQMVIDYPIGNMTVSRSRRQVQIDLYDSPLRNVNELIDALEQVKKQLY